ncbi:MAG TPA: GIY-YIG nuclease family protein, partial [Clostridium sp.]
YTGNEAYFKNYYEIFREGNTRECVYFILDVDGKVRYVGSTSNMYAREIEHINGFSSIQLTEEKWNENKLDHFVVSYNDEINKDERMLMEYYLIEKYKDNNLLNGTAPYKKRFEYIEQPRKTELEDMAEALIFNIYKRH